MDNRASDRAYWDNEIVQFIESFPLPTSVGWELYRYLNFERSGLDIAVEVAQGDPVFEALLIRFANSQGRGPKPVATVEEAIKLVGLSRVSRLALAYGLKLLSKDGLLIYGIGSDCYFRRSLACAFAVEFLFERCRSLDADLFAIGLLQSVGEIFIDLTLRDQKSDTFFRFSDESASRRADAEERALGINQAQVAGIVLRTWHFPETLVDPIEKQYSTRVGARNFELCQALTLARFISAKVAEEIAGGRPPDLKLKHVTFRQRRLSDAFEYALRQTRSVYEVMSTRFEN